MAKHYVNTDILGVVTFVAGASYRNREIQGTYALIQNYRASNVREGGHVTIVANRDGVLERARIRVQGSGEGYIILLGDAEEYNILDKTEFNNRPLPTGKPGRPRKSPQPEMVITDCGQQFLPQALLTRAQAADLLCGDAKDPVGALRKRISRGRVKVVLVGGEQRVVA